INWGPGAGVEGVEPVHRQRAHDLAHAVGPVVEAEDAVAGPDARRPRDDAGLHELVGLTDFVGTPDRRHRVEGYVAHAVHHRVVGDLGALPALVAVHGVIATDDRGDHWGSGIGARGSGPATSEPRAPNPESLNQLLHERKG